MTDSPDQGAPTPFFAAADDAVPGGYEEYQPQGESHPYDAPLAPSYPDPLDAPVPPPPAWPPPSEDSAAQPELEQLLRDVRGALATLPGDEPQPAAAPTAAAAPAGPGVDELREDVAGLQAAISDLRDGQALRHGELTARLDALAQAASEAAALAASRPAAPPPGGPDGITMTDLHDGLAGVRTDVAALPDAIGPAVTSAVAHGLAETTRQLDGVVAALTETAAESGQLRAELASLQVTLASLHEQVSVLPQVLAGLREVTDRLQDLEAATVSPPPVEPLPDVAGIVDERLAEHLTAFGTGLGERLDSQLDAVEAMVTAARGAEGQGVTHDELVNDMGERLAETERRLAERLDVLRATDTSGQLARQLDGVEGRMHEQLAAALAGERDVAGQLRAAELRITQHVDEAVLALAQAVLGGRPSAAAPSAPEATREPASFDPVAFEPATVPDDPADAEADGYPDEVGSYDDAAGSELLGVEPADVEPVPAYGTDDLGLLPPAMADPATEPDGVAEHGDHGAVEAWAKGDERYAALPVEPEDPYAEDDEPGVVEDLEDLDEGDDGDTDLDDTGDDGDTDLDDTGVDAGADESGDLTGSDGFDDADDAPDEDAPTDGTAEEPSYTLHTVGGPVDGDPERPELPPPFDPAPPPVTPDVLPDPEAEPAPARRGLFRRKR